MKKQILPMAHTMVGRSTCTEALKIAIEVTVVEDLPKSAKPTDLTFTNEDILISEYLMHLPLTTVQSYDFPYKKVNSPIFKPKRKKFKRR